MAKFYMTIGLPASGKSSYAKATVSDKVIWLSSDNIRLEVPGITHQQVFQRMQNEAIEALKNGKDVIYDATNVNDKFRRPTIQLIKQQVPDTTVIALLFVVPIDVCKARNAKREGIARVPEKVIDRMFRSFIPPSTDEGFDVIECKGADTRHTNLDEIWEDVEKCTHQNPHHSIELVSEHSEAMFNAINEELDNEVLSDLAMLHDIGKPYVKTVTDGIGHFYNHGEVGAYLYLTCVDVELTPYNLLLAKLIALHIKAFNYVKDGRYTKTYEKDLERFGEVINLLITFNKYDEMYA